MEALSRANSCSCLAFHRGLDRRLERAFDEVDHVGDREVGEGVLELHQDLGDAALAVRSGGDAFLRSQPGLDVRHRNFPPMAEVLLEILLDELPRQRGRARAGAGVEHADREFEVHLAVDEGALDGHGVGVPAGVLADERLAAQVVVEVELDEGASGKAPVGLEQRGKQQLEAGDGSAGGCRSVRRG